MKAIDWRPITSLTAKRLANAIINELNQREVEDQVAITLKRLQQKHKLRIMKKEIKKLMKNVR